MSYFDQVIPPSINTEIALQQPDRSISPFQQILQRVEKRAMDVVCERQPVAAELAGDNPIMIDPYSDYSPEDTNLWLDIFSKVYEDREFYARLFYLRGAGTVLVENQRWGYIFRPVVGPDGWGSQEEYNREKQCLNVYRDEVIKLLQEIKLN
jgi:hypothetical protein